jgi:hypothetical protein
MLNAAADRADVPHVFNAGRLAAVRQYPSQERPFDLSDPHRRGVARS